MKVKELIEKLNAMPEDLDVVLCNLNDDGDGDGNLPLPEIKSVEVVDAYNTEMMTEEVPCVFITFEG
jgi:3-dehydroquinate synthase class II